MTDTDPRPAITLALALVLSAVAGILLVDSLITNHVLRKAARELREFPNPPAPDAA